jgi:hypothetical protein
VADALSLKAYCHQLVTQALELREEMRELNLRVVPHCLSYNLTFQPILDDQIKEAQIEDTKLIWIKTQNSVS